MTGRRSSIAATTTRIAICAVLATVCALGASSAGREPFDVRVRVAHAGTSGPEGLRRSLESALVEELASRGCFRSVLRAEDENPSEGEILLKVRLDRHEAVVENDASVAERTRPQNRDLLDAYTVRIELDALAGILVPGLDLAVMTRPYSIRLRERPRYPGEDAETSAEATLRRDFARRIAKWACKTSAKKLARAERKTRASIENRAR